MWPTIIIASIIGVIFVAIIVRGVQKIKKGKGCCSCGGSCSGCGMSCSAEKDK